MTEEHWCFRSSHLYLVVRQFNSRPCPAAFGAADNFPGVETIVRRSCPEFTRPVGQLLSNGMREYPLPTLRFFGKTGTTP